MNRMKRVFAGLTCIAILFGMLAFVIPAPVYAAGNLTKFIFGFGGIRFEIGINPKLTDSDINNGYTIDNSSVYMPRYSFDLRDTVNSATPLEASIEGIAVLSTSIVPDQYSDDEYVWINGEAKPDGVIKIHITATDFRWESSAGVVIAVPFETEIRYYSDNGDGAIQYDRYHPVFEMDYKMRDHPFYSYVNGETVAWFDAAVISMEREKAEFLITIDLNGPVTGVIQTETQPAEINPGEDSGTSFWDQIVEGWDGAHTAATVAVSVGGVLAAAGAVAAIRGGTDGGSRKDGESEEKKKRYKMKIYKGFGNAIRRGAEPVQVWARIVEIVDGAEINRPDLSERITVSGTGMDVRPVGMQNTYMGAEVKIPADSQAQTATLCFIFTGEGGVFRNNVVFRVIGEPDIVFPSLSEDKQSWVLDGGETLNLAAGARGTARKRFLIENAAVEPKKLLLKAEEAGFEVGYEKVGQLAFAYDAVIENRSAPMEKEAGVFGEQRVVHVSIRAEFPDGTVAENSFCFGLWPQGITVLYSRGLENDIRNPRPGQPAILQDGRLQIRSYMDSSDKNGKIPYTAFDLCCAFPQADGTAKLVTAESCFTLEELRAEEEAARNVLEKYDCHITTFDGEDKRICALYPKSSNPELAGSYDVWLPVHVAAPEGTETAEIPLRLIGLDPGPPAEWTREYKLLLDAVPRYYPQERVRDKLRDIEENYGSPTKCDAAELRMLRRTLLNWSISYWQQQSALVEKSEWLYWSRVWLLSEWGARKLKWAGDIAFSLLICYFVGPNAEAILSPLKDFIAETTGEMIAATWGEDGSWEDLALFDPTYRPTSLEEWNKRNTRAEKYTRIFEDKLYSAFENLLSNLIDAEKLGTSFSVSNADARKLFLKAAFCVVGFILVDCFKNYREMKPNQRDYWTAFAKAFSNLSKLAVKKLFSHYAGKWLNSETMQKFFRGKLMTSVNSKVKGVQQQAYTYKGKPLVVRYQGQQILVMGQATGNVDVGRGEVHNLRLNLSDGRTAVIPNVKAADGNAYLGYIEVIGAILEDLFGKAVELDLTAPLKDMEKIFDGTSVLFPLALPEAISEAASMTARVDILKLCQDVDSNGFKLLFNAIFGCLKLSNEMTVNLLRMPYDNVMNIVATSKKFWDYLVNGTEVEQINWSFFEES